MSNYWIISRWPFHHHQTLDSARTEHARLSEKFPDRPFHIIRCKGALEPSDAPQTIARLRAEVEELVGALRGLKDEADKAGDWMGRHGQGSTLLGMAITKADNVLSKHEGKSDA